MTSTITASNVCDLNQIYQGSGGYNYSLPRGILETFFEGKGFDYKSTYTAEEKASLERDINKLFANILSTNPDHGKEAVITSGSPGSGKTVLLRDFMASSGKQYAYICPDDVCLKALSGYQADIEASKGQPNEKELRRAAYDKWRPASNAANHAILGRLILDQYSFCFGTTSSSPATKLFFKFLKDNGYTIRLLHVTAPDDTRWKSIQERDKEFVQTTETDIREKGTMVFQRIVDTNLSYADAIDFYYRGECSEPATLAARWIRSTDTSDKKGTLEIVNQMAYDKIKATHNEACDKLNQPEIKWEKAVEEVSLMN